MFTEKNIRVTVQMRKGQFAGGGNTITVEGLPISVAINKQGGSDPNKATVIIKNLKMETVKQLTMLAFKRLEANNNVLQVQAGELGKTLSLIYMGEISSAVPSIDTDGTLMLHIESAAGYYPSMIPAPPVSVQGTTSIENLLTQFAKEAGYEYQNNGITGSVRNCVFIGSPIKKAKQLAEQCAFDLIIDDGKFISQPFDAPKTGMIPLISSKSGLFGYPSFTNEGIEFTCLFNDLIKVGGYVSVESILPYATGEWQVTKVSHTLNVNDSGGSGNWETHVTGVLPGTDTTKKDKKK